MAEYLKWQTGAISTIGLGLLLLIISNLYGISHSDDGDKVCTDCWSEIKIKSTFWEIKVEHAGDKNAVFKKTVRGRTLWINLDKVDELVTTDPAVKVDIFVPTIKRLSTVNHPDYGYLRPLKNGDTLIKRNTESNPSPSRIILHGTKQAHQTIKWSFDIDYILMEDINIDPIWLPALGASKGKVTRGISGKDYTGTEICDIESTEETIDIFGLVPRIVEIFGNRYYDIINKSFCSDVPVNLTCNLGYSHSELKGELVDVVYYDNKKIGSYIDYKNKSVNCRLLGITTPLFRLDCPSGHRCSMEKGSFCALDLSDGADEEDWYDSSHRIDGSWSYACIKISDMILGKQIRTSTFKDTKLEVKRT